MGCEVVGGTPHTCTCMHMHAYASTHIYMLNMIISIASGGIPGDSLCDVICTHTCMHACAHV